MISCVQKGNISNPTENAKEQLDPSERISISRRQWQNVTLPILWRTTQVEENLKVQEKFVIQAAALHLQPQVRLHLQVIYSTVTFMTQGGNLI